MPEQEKEARRLRFDRSIVVSFFICLTAACTTGMVYIVHDVGDVVADNISRHEPKAETAATHPASFVADR